MSTGLGRLMVNAVQGELVAKVLPLKFTDTMPVSSGPMVVLTLPGTLAMPHRVAVQVPGLPDLPKRMVKELSRKPRIGMKYKAKRFVAE